MKNFEVVTTEKVVSITCDKCGNVVSSIEDGLDEVLSLRVRPGYYSVHFGDENSFSLDLCEKCSYELLGQYVKYDKEEENEDGAGAVS